jgi:mannose-6-phosphate isomerase-like protein (cupin superfamily)
MSNTKTLQIFRAGKGKAYQMGRMSLAFKRTDDEDEGSYSLLETTETPGTGAGVHRHPGYQETFIICEGRFQFEVDDAIHEVGPGDVVVVPTGAWHGFFCTSTEPGRMLIVSSPARVFEAAIAEVCAAKVDTGKPGGGPAVDMRAIAARHGVEFR